MTSLTLLAQHEDVSSQDEQGEQGKENPGWCEVHLLGLGNRPEVLEQLVRGSLLLPPLQTDSLPAGSPVFHLCWWWRFIEMFHMKNLEAVQRDPSRS